MQVLDVGCERSTSPEKAKRLSGWISEKRRPTIVVDLNNFYPLDDNMFDKGLRSRHGHLTDHIRSWRRSTASQVQRRNRYPCAPFFAARHGATTHLRATYYRFHYFDRTGPLRQLRHARIRPPNDKASDRLAPNCYGHKRLATQPGRLEQNMVRTGSGQRAHTSASRVTPPASRTTIRM